MCTSHAVEAEDASSEQTVSLEGMSPFRTPVAALKTEPYDMSGPGSKDIFHPTEQPGGESQAEATQV